MPFILVYADLQRNVKWDGVALERVSILTAPAPAPPPAPPPAAPPSAPEGAECDEAADRFRESKSSNDVEPGAPRRVGTSPRVRGDAPSHAACDGGRAEELQRCGGGDGDAAGGGGGALVYYSLG